MYRQFYSLGKKVVFVLAGICLLGLGNNLCAADYYVSSTGNDNNAGTSTTQAWKTIAKVNLLDLNTGDRVLFEGGKQFDGLLKLTSEDAGSSGSPITITSYGTGRAIIYGNTGDCIWLDGAKYVTLKNINATGAGRGSGTTVVSRGMAVHLSRTQNIIVQDVEATGTRCGVYFTSSSFLRIERIYGHHNGYAGIYGGGYHLGQNTSLGMNVGANSDVYIGHCRLDYNTGDPNNNVGTFITESSGFGIHCLRTDRLTIEYCTVGWNAGDDNPNLQWGPCGIMPQASKDVLVQYCIAHHQGTANGVDGVGFDMEGPVNGILQYCLSYENIGGYMLYYWQGEPAMTVRYNISMNNNLRIQNFCGELRLTAPFNSNIYNNLFINTKYNNPLLNFYYMGNGANNTFRNNIFYAKSSSLYTFGLGDNYGGVFQGNCYYAADGNFNIGGNTSLSAWRTATGQEKIGTRAVGFFGDPQFLSLTNIPQITDPDSLADLFAFKLLSTSPCIDAGLDLKSEFGIDPGSKDFFGTTLPFGSKFDVGPYEYNSPVGMPVFVPQGGYYSSSQNVTITSTSQGAVIHYTTDNSDPTESSPVFSAGIPVTDHKVIKARAYKTGMSPSQIVTASYRILSGAPSNEQLTNGVTYAYYEGTSWTSMPNFSNLTPVREGTCSNISLQQVTHRANDYAIVFSGYVNIPDGMYTFSTISDDGSKLYLGNDLMINNDGLHESMGRVTGNPVWIKSGKYPVRVEYFFSSGINYLIAEWQLSGSSRERIPMENLFYASTTSLKPFKATKTCLQTGIYRSGPGYSIHIAEKGKHTVQFINAVGQQTKMFIGKNSESYFVPASRFMSGVYLVKITTENTSVSQKVAVCY